MELTKQQSQEFIDRYLDRYNMKMWDPLPSIKKEDESKELNVWKKKCWDILWYQADKTYKYRAYGRETRLDKVVNSLWLNYWPIFK